MSWDPPGCPWDAPGCPQDAPGCPGTHGDVPRTHGSARTGTSTAPELLPRPMMSSRPIYSPSRGTGTATGPGPRPRSCWDISGTFLPRCWGRHRGSAPRGGEVWGSPSLLQAIKGPWAHPRAALICACWGGGTAVSPRVTSSSRSLEGRVHPLWLSCGAGTVVSPWLCVTLCHPKSPSPATAGAPWGSGPCGCGWSPHVTSPWGFWLSAAPLCHPTLPLRGL